MWKEVKSPMLIVSNFQSESNQKEILPFKQEALPYACMYRNMSKYGDGNFPWHWHAAFEIDYIANGELEFRTADTNFTLKKGDAVFINSGVMHAYRAKTESECEIYAHLFDAHFLSGMHHNAIEEKYVLPVMNSQELQIFPIRPDSYENVCMMEKILEMIRLSHEEPFGYELEIRAQLGRFWCLFLKATEEIRARNVPKSNTDIERVKVMMHFIHEHYREKITLEDIAASANISERECTRSFQHCIDNSPVNYLNSYRVYVAAQMLLQTGDSIITISENCGFSSNSYFGKVFHESMGCTPSEYRRGRKPA